MRILKKLKRPVALASLVGCIVFVAVPPAFSQIVERSVWRQDFLSRDYRPRWGEEYENFGDHDYRRYPSVRYDTVSQMIDKQGNVDLPVPPAQPVKRGPISPVTYDQFGNFLLPGGEIYSFNWNKSRIGAFEEANDSWMNSIFNRLVILSDDFSNWQTKFMVARAELNDDDVPQYGIRAYFTPSTLKITNLNGIRWDLSSRKNNVTFVASTGQLEEGGIPLYGVHWQSILGDVLKVGATYVHKQRGTVENSHNDIDEQIRDEPRYVYLVVTDDSPADAGPGARVYGVSAIINGEHTPIAFHGENYPVKGRAFRVPNVIEAHHYAGGEFSPYYLLSDSDNQAYHRRLENQRNNYGSWFLDLMNDPIINDPLADANYGRNSAFERFFSKTTGSELGIINVAAADVTGDPDDQWDPDVPGDVQTLRYYKADDSRGYIEASGSDVIVYEFLIPSGTRDLSFNVKAANDYCIDIIAAMYRRQRVPHENVPWYSNTAGAWNVWYDFKNAAKAPGNVKDASNIEVVKVSYDRIVSTDTYGMNLELDWNGLFVRAEYNLNTVQRGYPVAQHVSNKGETNSKTERAWFVNVEKDLGATSIGGEFFDYPMDYMRYWPSVEDNDDNNRWVGTHAITGDRVVSNRYADYTDRPGLDVDFDLYPDFDWQNNLYIDYYYDTIRHGDDFNHNGIVDYREDNTTIDLPYERDSRGQHYFFKIHPSDNTLVTLGHYDIRQDIQDGRNFTRYLKLEHYQPLSDLGEVVFYSRTERVKDNYKLQPAYFGDNDDPGYRSAGHHYPIDNWQTANYLQTRLTFIPNTNIINNAELRTSYELGDLYRPEERSFDERVRNFLQVHDDGELINRYGGYSAAFEHKADYTIRMADARLLPEVSFAGIRLWKEKRIRELRIMPAFKFVHRYNIHQENDFDLYNHDQRQRIIDFYPLIRMDYRVSPNTLFRFAMQGIPGFEQIHRNSTEKLNDTDQTNFIVALENSTLYQGFNLLVTMGVSGVKTEYINDPGLQVTQGEYNTRYFIMVRSEASR